MNIFKTIKRNVPVLVLAGLLTTSCADYLDVAPPEQAGLKDAVKNYDKTLDFLYSCYAGIHNPMSGYSNIEGAADEYVLPSLWNEVGQRNTWGQNSPTNTNDNQIWDKSYRYIGQIHLFLRNLENAKGITEEDKKQWIAECDFLLAFYHMQVLTKYGPCPIIEELVAPDTSSSEFKGRYHFDYVTNWIVEKFDKAAEVLPSSREGEKWGRATSVAAKAFKARLLLYAASPLWNGSFPYPNWKNTNFETPGYGKDLVSTTYDRQKWEKAKQACLEAITAATGAGHALYTDEDYYSRQGIALPFVPGVSDNTTEGQNFLKKVMLYRYLVTTRRGEGNNEIIFMHHDNGNLYSGMIPHYVHTNRNGNRYGLYSGIAPILNTTIQYFYTKNGCRPEHDTQFVQKSEWYQKAGISGRDNIIKLNVNREPRFYAWFAFDDGDMGNKLTKGQPLRINLRDSELQGYNPARYPRDNNMTGYFSQKFLAPKTEVSETGSMSGGESKPRPLLRLAELYLNLAECYAELGNETEAIAQLNIIRQRAGVPNLTSADMSKQNIKEWVRNERFIELWMEGHRYYDIRRWMIAPQTMAKDTRMGLSAYGKINPTFEELNTPSIIQQDFRWFNNMYLQPIQFNEKAKNPQLVQAPGF